MAMLLAVFACVAIVAGAVEPADVAIPSWACAETVQLYGNASQPNRTLSEPPATTTPGQQVAEVNGAELTDLLEEYRGKSDVLITFYAHWCGHCKTFVMADKNGDASNAPLENLNRELIAINGPKVVKLNTAKARLPKGFTVMFIPTIVLVRWTDVYMTTIVKKSFQGNPNDLTALKAFALSGSYEQTPAGNKTALIQQHVQGPTLRGASKKPAFVQKYNKAVGACMDMCAEIHDSLSLQECQHKCGADVTYGTADTSVMCMHMCTEALGNSPLDCQHKC